MERDQPAQQSRHALRWACIFSALLLIMFGWLQTSKSPVLDLKAQWLWVALVPILLALITGKYVGKFKGAGIEFEQFKAEPDMRLLSYVAPPAPTTPGAPQPTERALTESPWTVDRSAEYERTKGLFLVHVYEPSTRPNQTYDVTVFLIRHKKGPEPNQRDGFTEVEKIEFYFGPSWNDDIFTAHNDGALVGVRTSAWGSFLAIGRVIFKDGQTPLILHRYIDFEMAPKKISTSS